MAFCKDKSLPVQYAIVLPWQTSHLHCTFLLFKSTVDIYGCSCLFKVENEHGEYVQLTPFQISKEQKTV